MDLRFNLKFSLKKEGFLKIMSNYYILNNKEIYKIRVNITLDPPKTIYNSL